MSSGHLFIMCLLPCIINDEHLMLSFGKDLHGQSSCHLYMAFQLLQNSASDHVKVKRGTGHVIYVATPSHSTESAGKMYLNALFQYLWKHTISEVMYLDNKII